jgi:hypothetical protein
MAQHGIDESTGVFLPDGTNFVLQDRVFQGNGLQFGF